MTSSTVLPKQVLIIEDDEGLCQLAAADLREAGFRALAAYTGETGLELFKSRQPDAVIIDVGLPGISGFEVAAEIRKSEPPDKHTVIVIMTAYARSYLVSQDLEVGIDAFLTKPVLASTLTERIASLLK